MHPPSVAPIETLASPTASEAPPAAWMLPACLAFVASADALFYARPIGWTLGCFALSLLAVLALFNRRLLTDRVGCTLFWLTAGLCVALVEDPSALAIAMFLIGLVSFLASGERSVFASPLRWSEGLLITGLQSCARISADAGRVGEFIGGDGQRSWVVGVARAWLLPTGCALIFVVLFASANPLIDQWLTALDARAVFEQLPSAPRALFWIGCGGGVWFLFRTRLVDIQAWRQGLAAALLAPTTVNTQPNVSQHKVEPGTGVYAFVFSKAAIMRSMIVFNLLFALQNGLDLAYLWGGGKLPAGFTFASYAHRGAYPLIATALLAGVFVLIAFQPNARSSRATGHATGVRWLMYLWIAQNILLVISSIWRTLIYVEVYSLTYLRVAALVWMGLVAVGLALIVVRVMRERSNRWLFDANLKALGAVLYATCFLNVGGIVADYNIAHCQDLGGRGVQLDLDYIGEIGPAALPALRRFVETVSPGSGGHARRGEARAIATTLQRDVDRHLADWRGWTWRLHRINRQAARPLP